MKMTFSALFLFFLVMKVHSQMMPVPDPSEKEPETNPFKMEQNQKFVKDTVLELDSAGLAQILQAFPQVVVYFREKSFDPEELKNFTQIAKRIKKTYPIIFAYITEEKGATSFLKHGVKNHTSLIYFEKMRRNIYKGDLGDYDHIHSFLKELLKNELMIIKTQDDFHKFHNSQKTKLLAVYDESMIKETSLIKNFVEKKLFSETGNFLIGLTNDQSVIPIPNNLEMPSLILYNYFDDESDYDENSTVVKYDGKLTDGEEIMSFCQLNSLPLVTIYSEETAFRLFAGPVPTQLILFLNKTANNTKELEAFKKAAKYNKQEELFYERILFTVIYSAEENKEFLEFFGIDESSLLPQIFLTKIDNYFQRLDRYEYTKDEIDEEFIRDFISEFRKKEIKRFYKSQSAQPDNWPKNLVGSEYPTKVIHTRDNYVVLFCAPSEEVCRSPVKFFNYLANKVSVENRTNITFANFDVSKNEADGLNVHRIPELRIYLKGEKKKPKIFKDEFNLEKIYKFLHVYINSLPINELTAEEISEFNLKLMDEEDGNMFKKNTNTDPIVEGISEEDERNLEINKKSEL